MASGKLVRSTTDRKIAGIAGGMAQYFNVDATLMRILWILVALPGGLSILIYFVLWIVIPEEGADGSARASGAIAIAEERYARGEITAEEMTRIREDLSK